MPPTTGPRSTRRPARALTAGVALAAFATAGSASTATAASPTPSPSPSSQSLTQSPERATFGVRPSDKQDPRHPNKLGPGDRRGFLEFNGTPGGRFDDYIAVANYGLVPLHLNLYATDAYNDKLGGFALLDTAQKPKDAGTWIRVGTPHGDGFLDVAPRSRVVVPVHVVFPATASPGDHVAGIVASYVTQKKVPGQPNVRLDQRVGVRAFMRVGGPLHPQLRVERLRAVYHGGLGLSARTTVSWVLRNVGNVKLGASQKVSISGLFGRTGKVVGRVPDINVLLPGNTAQETVEVSGVRPWLVMTARVDAQPGVPTTDVDPGVRPVSASVTFLAIPWILVVAIGLVFVIGYVRRRLRKQLAEPGARASHRRKGSRRLTPKVVS